MGNVGHVGIEEHGAVGYAASVHIIKGVAGDFPVVDEDIVAAGVGGVQAEGTEEGCHDACVVCECGDDIAGSGDVAEHDVVPVGKDASSAAFASVELNAVVAAVVKVDFHFYPLVASEDDCRVNLPEEENVVVDSGESGGSPFLHGEVER